MLRLVIYLPWMNVRSFNSVSERKRSVQNRGNHDACLTRLDKLSLTSMTGQLHAGKGILRQYGGLWPFLAGLWWSVLTVFMWERAVCMKRSPQARGLIKEITTGPWRGVSAWEADCLQTTLAAMPTRASWKGSSPRWSRLTEVEEKKDPGLVLQTSIPA